LRTLLFGVSPTELMPLAGATVFLIGIGLLASVVPAWRAAHVNPVDALRVE
jgi:ABC-type lipoprotein release transport system permease subunit